VNLRGGKRGTDLERVYREHVGAVYAFFAYSVSRPSAEDLTSTTFERVLRSWASYDSARGSERTWILTIARNLLVDHFRRSSHRDGLSTDEHPGLLDRLVEPDDEIGRVLDADELRAWLRPLGSREREILALRYAADLPAADIAAIMGLSGANVHQILSRSLRRLRQQGQGLTSSV
jgi:RNA polymerase sigma factor (sigma-70 family)